MRLGTWVILTSVGSTAIKGVTISLFFSLFPGGSGKHRPKEPKKKNKQRLRFRAQNQHSDHLASARTGQWGLKLPTSHWTKNQRKAASRCCTHILTDDCPEPHQLPTCLPAQPYLPHCPPGHSHDSQVLHYKNICLTYNISISTLNTRFMPLPPAASPPAAVTSQVTLFSKPHPLPCLVDLYSWHYRTHFPSLTMLLSCTVMEDERATRDCGGRRAERRGVDRTGGKGVGKLNRSRKEGVVGGLNHEGWWRMKRQKR